MPRMNLKEALQINNAARKSSSRIAVFLAAGFTPLSLPQFLAAHLSRRMGGCRVEVKAGLFGDLPGNIERIEQSQADFAAICIEWDDLDSRLGFRRLSATTWKDLPEVLSQAKEASHRLLSLIVNAAARRRIAVSLPHLPIPPVSYSPPHRMGEFEARLRMIVAEMQVELASTKSVHVLAQSTSRCSDFPATLNVGFPYSGEHASDLGEMLASALVPASPKKGIIVDLDETLWRGILGEDGIDGVHWDLDHHAQHHGLFQQLLNSLAAEGTLIAIASKNSAELVREIFDRRSDLLLKAESVFPVEVHWRSKSESVSRILQAWNVAADAVTFVDDSPLELAEVQAAHPGISCKLFPAQDLAQFELLLQELRSMYAKERIEEEDALRSESLRNRARIFVQDSSNADPEMLLRGLKAELTFEIGADASDERALELVNKTNQFNLNGTRFIEPLWRKALDLPGAFLLTCAYKDKFGALGKIAVMMGVADPQRVLVQSWVMSCRAFARRIEFACLQQVFHLFSAEEVVLNYRRTERNGPFHDMLESLQAGPHMDGDIVFSRAEFDSRTPALYHCVIANSKEPKVEKYV